MDYINFVLRLGEWDPVTNTGVAEVAQSPVGEAAPYPFTLQIDGRYNNQRAQRTSATAAERSTPGSKMAPASTSAVMPPTWHPTFTRPLST